MPKLPVGRVVERKKTGKKLKPVTVYLDVAVYERLRRHALEDGRQMSWIIANLVTEYLQKHDR